jgi:hypothetical protein
LGLPDLRKVRSIDGGIYNEKAEGDTHYPFDDISKKTQKRDDAMAEAYHEAHSEEYREIADFQTKEDNRHSGVRGVADENGLWM